MRENFQGDTLENSIAFEVMHIYRRLLQRGSQAMERMNIGVGQVPILTLLSENGTMTQRQIAEEIRVTPATICGTMKRMEKAGLVRREANEKDGRVSCISLTEEGRVRMTEAKAAIDQSHSEMLSNFSEEELRTLYNFVSRMGKNLMRAVDLAEEEGK